MIDDAQPTFMASLSSLFASALGLAITFATPRRVPRYPSGDEKGKAAPAEDNQFGALCVWRLVELSDRRRPPREIVGLLPLYDLLRSNEAFGALLLAEVAAAAASASANRAAPPPFLAVFVSAASYIFCHASASVRSRMSSRLALLILTLVVDAGSAIAGPECAVEVRLCRQVRTPPARLD